METNPIRDYRNPEAIRPINLRHGEFVDDDSAIMRALDGMIVALGAMKDASGLRILVHAELPLVRKHLTAFLEAAMDEENPMRADPKAVMLKGFGAPRAQS